MKVTLHDEEDFTQEETKKTSKSKKRKTKAPKKIKRNAKGERTAFNPGGILREIHSYGYSYSVGKYVLHSLILFGIILGLALFVHLKLPYILFLGVVVMGIMPLLVIGQFRTLHTLKRFMMVTNYLDNIIPIFKQKPKILYSLKAVLSLTDGEMKRAVQEAIDYIEANTKDTDVYKNALGLIEKHFANSRIVSTHKIMISIEQGNSKNYQAGMMNIYYDVQAWINRIYTFQDELKNQRLLKIVLCVAVLAIGCYMPYAFTNNDVLRDFAETPLYHISITAYITLFLIIIGTIQTKMNGSWLVDDYKTDGQEKLMERHKRTKDSSVKLSTPEMVMVGIFSCLALYAFATSPMVGLLLALIIAFLLMNKQMARKKRLKAIRQYVIMEYPVWLRDVALNLHGHTVVTAISMSLENCSPIMKYEVEKLLAAIEADPVSIVPFDNFLQEYELIDVKASMKVLFSLQSLDGESLEEQVNSLIVRNQDLLSKSESMRNKAYLNNIGWVGFVPWVAFLLFSIVILAGILVHTIGYLSTIVETAGGE